MGVDHNKERRSASKFPCRKRGILLRMLLCLGLVSKGKTVKNGSGLISAGVRADNIMECRKLFLDPGMDLNKLAREAGTNRTYISKYLSIEKGCSFRDYLNSFRAEYASDIISEGKYKTLSDIAMLSGFGSVRSFNSAFIKRYGISPSMRIKYQRDDT
jgi:AraC-like DNA-binding protein